ncbi:MAG TPA: hypothetical protein VL240_01905 [Candidatus Binatia bacterium]|nr:hypothetical protein [Candidatus Binatia bacterium]
MPRNGKPESSTVHTGDSSFVSLLSGWVQQGVENFFATQRILVDLAMSQNANVMNMVRSRFAGPDFCPAAIASELAGEAISNFIEGQKLLLGLARREHEIVTNGVKERVSSSKAAVAMTELAQRGFNTFVDMQQEFLKMASKQTHAWLTAVKDGRGFDPDNLVELAREGMDTFVHTQKKFLDMVAEETSKATSGKEPVRKMKKTELSELAKEATDAYIDAQKKLIDVAGRQVKANMRAAGRTMNMIAPFPFIPIPDLTREGVKNFVSAEKALIDTMMHRPEPKRPVRTTARRKRPVRTIKVEAARATA